MQACMKSVQATCKLAHASAYKLRASFAGSCMQLTARAPTAVQVQASVCKAQHGSMHIFSSLDTIIYDVPRIHYWQLHARLHAAAASCIQADCMQRHAS